MPCFNLKVHCFQLSHGCSPSGLCGTSFSHFPWWTQLKSHLGIFPSSLLSVWAVHLHDMLFSSNSIHLALVRFVAIDLRSKFSSDKFRRKYYLQMPVVCLPKHSLITWSVLIFDLRILNFSGSHFIVSLFVLFLS